MNDRRVHEVGRLTEDNRKELFERRRRLGGRRRLGEGETWRKENSWDKEVESPLDPIPPPRRPRAS